MWKSAADGSHLRISGSQRRPRKPAFWPGKNTLGLAMIASGSITELNGPRSVGFSILMIEPIVGQSVGASARMSGPTYL